MTDKSMAVKKVRDVRVWICLKVSKQNSMRDGQEVCESKGYRMTHGFLDSTTGKIRSPVTKMEKSVGEWVWGRIGELSFGDVMCLKPVCYSSDTLNR